MKQEWVILTLGGYLEEVQFPNWFAGGTTFSTTLKATDNLPEVTVGLGMLTSVGNGFAVQFVPPIKHAPKVLLNTFINEVAEQYLNLSEKVENWQELLLLNLGYVKRMSYERNAANKVVLFNSIPEEARLFLLKKYGFHKIATIAAYGHTENIDAVLTTLDEMSKDLPEEANYGTVMHLLAAGVPVEELHIAVQLPPEMAAEIYSQD